MGTRGQHGRVLVISITSTTLHLYLCVGRQFQCHKLPSVPKGNIRGSEEEKLAIPKKKNISQDSLMAQTISLDIFF